MNTTNDNHPERTRLTFSKPFFVGLLIGAVCFLLTLSMLLASLITALTGNPSPTLYDPTSPSSEYSYINVQLLTEEFAYSEELGKTASHFFFAVDQDNVPYILCLSNAQFKALAPIFEYTYGSSEDAPEPVRVCGIPVLLDRELRALAIDAFNQIWDGDHITDENMDTYLGISYLDCTVDHIKNANANILSFALLFFTGAVLAFVGCFAVYRRQKKAAEQAAESSRKFDWATLCNTVAEENDGSDDEVEEAERVTIASEEDAPSSSEIFEEVTLCNAENGENESAADGVFEDFDQVTRCNTVAEENDNPADDEVEEANRVTLCNIENGENNSAADDAFEGSDRVTLCNTENTENHSAADGELDNSNQLAPEEADLLN